MNSKLFKLNKFDFIKGALLAALTSILTYVYTLVESGSLLIDWNLILKIGLLSFIGYLVKNVFTNKEGKPLTKEVKNANDN